MPRTAEINQAALDHLLARQQGLLTRAQALACGFSERMVGYRTRPGGPWQAVLPGVYLSATGIPTAGQREIAALLYGGPGSVVTGRAALFRHGVRVSHTTLVDVLVPAATHRRDRGWVRLHRTTRMPAQIQVEGVLRYAPVARAIVDTLRGVPDIREVRAVVADAVQRGRCPLGLLAEEVRRSAPQGTTGLRQTLAEVAEGVRSAAESDLRDLITRSKLPAPLYNARLYADGVFLAVPDCWWASAGVAAEVDSREWHLSPDGWARTLARHARMSAYGIVVLHFTPRQIRSDGAAVAATIRSALGSGRPVARVSARAAS